LHTPSSARGRWRRRRGLRCCRAGAGAESLRRLVALIERLGNALGTLAFTWATVVLLGGYSKDLSLDDDFWYATAIVFLEATRYAN
jgi:uncharacterized SAM-binding protein YcdF (DUF218 family)